MKYTWDLAATACRDKPSNQGHGWAAPCRDCINEVAEAETADAAAMLQSVKAIAARAALSDGDPARAIHHILTLLGDVP